jgi:adenylate cyclase
VSVLVSVVIAQAAREKFRFRRVDRVAVKGKAQGVDVYELLGQRDGEIANLPQIERYEAAFAAYLARDFAAAAALLAPASDDPPSVVLRARCAALEAQPPPADWNGVHIAVSK